MAIMGVAIAQFAEAESKKESLNLQSKQNEIQYNQKR